jgi:hypothetical protein
MSERLSPIEAAARKLGTGVEYVHEIPHAGSCAEGVPNTSDLCLLEKGHTSPHDASIFIDEQGRRWGRR